MGGEGGGKRGGGINHLSKYLADFGRSDEITFSSKNIPLHVVTL